MKFLVLVVFLFSQSVLADEASAIKAANKMGKAHVERATQWKAATDESPEVHGILKLRLDKPDLILKDSGGGDGTRSYEFISYLPQGFYFVRLHFYEGGTYFLYRRTDGHKIRVEAKPVFSSSGKAIAFANVDLEAGYSPNKIGIFELNAKTNNWSESFSKGDHHKGKNYPVRKLKWLSNTKLSFTKIKMDGKSYKEVGIATGILEKVDGKWALTETPIAK